MNELAKNAIEKIIRYFYDKVIDDNPEIPDIMDSIHEQALTVFENANIDLVYSCDDIIDTITHNIIVDHQIASVFNINNWFTYLNEERPITDLSGHDLIDHIIALYNRDDDNSVYGYLSTLVATISDSVLTHCIKMLVYFPKVTVTNELDESEDISDLYVRLYIKPNGKLADTFKMLRSSLTLSQASVGYSHSHLPHVSNSSFAIFKYPCLGSGPLCRTISNLKSEYSEDFWGLFFYELSIYVTVESLHGGPYIKISNIKARGATPVDFKYIDKYTSFDSVYSESSSIQSYLITHLLNSDILKFNFTNGVYKIANNPCDLVITLTNVARHYISKLINNNREKDLDVDNAAILQESLYYFKKYSIKDGIIYSNTSNYKIDNDFKFEGKEGTVLFRFKNEPVLFKITNKTLEDSTTYELLDMILVNHILSFINIIINNGSATKRIVSENC